jgi:hypothetical protein
MLGVLQTGGVKASRLEHRKKGLRTRLPNRQFKFEKRSQLFIRDESGDEDTLLLVGLY